MTEVSLKSAGDYTFPLNVVQIQELIPHRPPFLLIEKVTEAVVDDYLIGLRQISVSDPLLQGHFPGNPVVPGVVIVEGMAQAACVLGRLTANQEIKECLLTEVTSARFKRPVVPGETIVYHVKKIKNRRTFFWFEAKAMVDGELAALVNLSAHLA